MSESHYDCPCMEKCPLHYAMNVIGGKWKVSGENLRKFINGEG